MRAFAQVRLRHVAFGPLLHRQHFPVALLVAVGEAVEVTHLPVHADGGEMKRQPMRAIRHVDRAPISIGRNITAPVYFERHGCGRRHRDGRVAYRAFVRRYPDVPLRVFGKRVDAAAGDGKGFAGVDGRDQIAADEREFFHLPFVGADP